MTANLTWARERFPSLNPTRAGVLLFSAAVLTGPWYGVSGYSVVGNSISELAAQNTENNFIMRAGFLALGIGTIADGVRHFRSAHAAFVAFGLFMALAGVFGHKPIAHDVPYRAFADRAHSALAMLAGIAITVALVWRGLRARTRAQRFSAFALASLCIVLPLGMVGFPPYQGLIQRVMYACVFAWLWAYYPASHPIPTGRPVEAVPG